ncbi:hypothetical protein psyc5s11_06200 [Clostridium gelidum]|uniref:SCP domain-containing protein n=1 Tax=Clostridium gelidum TaxID=704125 RepID=A0ABM7T023_9CLOT|nr:CAP domain-containing protein [Clostridium gelidum]BCZ44553.1 hypothetical protein psyc5s11_06200 [Clostridium gelidum]
MKKAFIRKMVLAVIAATSISTLSTLGVSAATNDATSNNFYNSIINKTLEAGWVYDNGTWYYNNTIGNLKTGWINDNGRWYFCDNTGAMQTGVIKVNGKTYCLNKAGALETGKVTVNNKTYKCSVDGQVTGTKVPTSDKVFDSNNNVTKDNNQNSTVSEPNNNQGTTNTGTTTNTTTESNTSTGTTATTSTGNATSTGTDTNVGNTNNTGNTSNSGTTASTGSTTSTNATSVDVQGLPQLPTTYSINVQASVEDKILELMNAKRVEAGLKPLTIDNTLVQVARYKSDHMIQYNYFDHVTPQGTKYSDWLKAVGYTYTTAGENIAYNNYDAVELFTQWWNSPGHRANMMNSSYTKVGIGVVQGNNKFMGTQEFSN